MPVIMKDNVQYAYTTKGTVFHTLSNAEYEALTEEEKMNGDVYCIPDREPVINPDQLWEKVGTGTLDIGDDLTDGVNQLNTSSVDNIRLGNFMGTIQRYGRLRIISIYNANGLQAATSVQLTSTDYPTVDVSVFNWVLITESPQTYGTRKLSLSTAGVLSTDNSVVRGGWVMVYIAKN